MTVLPYVTLTIFSLAVIYYVLFVNRFWLRFCGLFILLCVILGAGSFFLCFHFRPSISYPAILAVNALGIALLVIILISMKLSGPKSVFLPVITIIAFTTLSLIAPINLVAQSNCYLKVDRNIQNLESYVAHDSEIWPEYLLHFPSKIPDKCEATSFFRGRLYDLTIIQLRCTLPANEVEKILEKHLPNAVFVQEGYKTENIPHGAYLVQRFRNKKNTGFAPLPRHFKVMVLHIDSKANSSPWQLNYQCGIAVSTKINEVIFWAVYP